MRTIRTNCFETNSSSTHSLTVETLSNAEHGSIESLVENGILYPARLQDKTVGAQLNTTSGWYGGGRWTFRAATMDAKAAMLVHQLYSFLVDSDYGDTTTNTDVFNQALYAISDACGYEGIDIGEKFWSQHSIDTYGDVNYYGEVTVEDFLGTSLKQKPMICWIGLNTYIKNVIINPFKAIINETEDN